MPVELSTAWVIALNVTGWPVIHLVIAWLITRLPQQFFSTETKWTRPHEWEAMIYTRFLHLRRWKQFLPDGAPWVQGLPKRNLRSTDDSHLQSFICETRRGEAAHWLMLLTGGIFILWNPIWADAVMAGYAVAANLPCILTQRYNRWRLAKILTSRRKHPQSG